MILKKREVEDIDNMTPNEIFDQAILTDDRETILDIAQYFEFEKVEIFWKRLMCGIKFNSTTVLKSLRKAFKDGIPETWIDHVNKHGTDLAKRILLEDNWEKIEAPADDPAIYYSLKAIKERAKRQKDEKEETNDENEENEQPQADSVEQTPEEPTVNE